MEILIVGAVVVALMVFVSTKIKKNVAAAFEPETIENAEFRLLKPEGFINPLNDDSEFAFVAYTREFGKNDAEEFRQARADVTIFSDLNFTAAIKNVEKNSGKVLSKNLTEDVSQRQKTFLIATENIEQNVAVRNFYKIVESGENHKIYQMQVLVLEAYQAEYSERINQLIESFTVK
ncbi:MAG: hypothetical protein ACR2L1_11220 [Pyrinomonadaceae bacterium]